jgi:predicted ATPase
MLTHLRIQGFRCLQDTATDLTPITVFIGPNDSGKSSILDSLYALSQIVRNGIERHALQQWAFDRFALPEALSDGSSEQRKWKTRLLFRSQDSSDVFDYELLMRFSGDGDYLPTKENLSVGGENLARSDGAKTIHFREERGHPEKKEQRFENQSLGTTPKIPEGLKSKWFPFRSIAMQSFKASALAAPCEIQARGVPRLGVDGSGLAAVLDYILGFERERFDKLEGDLKRFSPMIDKIQLRPAEPGPDRSFRGVGKVVFFKSKDGSVVPAFQASDGLLFALGFLAVLYSPEPPRVLLVEEPENGIHPENLEVVMGLFRRLAEGHFDAPPVQVLLTTHSPYLLDYAQPEEVRVVTRNEKFGTQITPMTDIPNLKDELSEFKLGELWTAIGDEAIGKGKTG